MRDLEQITIFQSQELSPVLSSKVHSAVAALSEQGDSAARGAIFTRREVVDFILDLVGYSPDLPLHTFSCLEPSFGDGDFLFPVIERLLQAWRSHGSIGTPRVALVDAIRAVELHHETYSSTRQNVIRALTTNGVSKADATALANRWLLQGDYLLQSFSKRFDFIIGNPPYVRQEMIPGVLLEEYRRRYNTLYDRADLYIPFFEAALTTLAEGGRLGFICADRWMKNRYGGPLRKLISERYHVEVYVDMVGTNAFHREVSTYPGIIVIRNAQSGPTITSHPPRIDAGELRKLAMKLRGKNNQRNGVSPVRTTQIRRGSDPWLLDSSGRFEVVRRVEARFPPLESVGCSVGIGVATGSDAVFIGNFEEMDVEPSRKLRLVTTNDIRSGEIIWSGGGVINPFEEDGSLVSLQNYPLLSRYFHAHRDVLQARHVARKNTQAWYRTIDRIHTPLVARPKLLIPDIKGEAHVVFDPGEYYPHHNLYYIVTREWEIRALQAVLLSKLSTEFIKVYSTQMRGGYVRFQAQYLRRLRLPAWREVSSEMRTALRKAAVQRDIPLCDELVIKLYGLSDSEIRILHGSEEI